MTIDEKESPRRYGLFALALGLFVAGLVINVIYFNDFALRSLALALALVSLLLFKASHVGLLNRIFTGSNSGSGSQVRKRPGPLAWTLALGSLAASGISFIFMLQDQAAGGNDMWPLYAFAASGVCGALTWGYVVSKLM